MHGSASGSGPIPGPPMRRVVRATASAIISLLAVVLQAGANDLRIHVLASGQGTYGDSPVSWLDDGFGKLQVGSSSDGSAEVAGSVDLQAGFRLELGEHWAGWAHVIARGESDAATDGAIGVTELWIEGTRDLAGGGLRVRAGTMFLPTSRENVDALWSSPYTISLSAINSWIGEEVRPTGIDVDYRYEFGSAVVLRGGATSFVGNDAAGTLLGWRGWSIGNRLSLWDEDLPLPPLSSLDTSFPAQKDGTTPIGSDLDGEVGWSARLRLDAPGGFVAQWTRYDNRGDRALHDDQYSWRSTFDLVGASWQPVESLTVAAEHIRGTTGMGFAPGDRVDARFESTYALASLSVGQLRVSTRFDWFDVEELDFSGAENNGESGSAVAVALLMEVARDWTLAVEFDDVDATRPSARDALGTASLDGRALIVQLRYRGLID